MREMLDSQWSAFVLHGATGLEHLVKAYLASFHPSLIAAGDMDSQLHASGHSDRAQTPKSAMKTIRIRDALERAARLLPSLRDDLGTLGLFVDVRNGFVHLGLDAPHETIETFVGPFLRSVRELLTALGEDVVSFWSTDYWEVVDRRVTDSQEQLQTYVQDRLAAARLLFQDRYGEFEGEQQVAVIKAIESAQAAHGLQEQFGECPVCSTRVVVEGDIEVDWEVDVEYEGPDEYSQHAYPVVTFSPSRFRCPACNLELEGMAELAAADMEGSWILEDLDDQELRVIYQDAYSDYEYDDYR